MTMLFLDTQFNSSKPDGELLSIALITLDGSAEFYGERDDIRPVRYGDFACAEVLAQFWQYPNARCDIQALRSRLRDWLAGLLPPHWPSDEPHSFVACDNHKDFSLLMQLLNDAWPTYLPPVYYRLECVAGLADWLDQYHPHHIEEHHALHSVRTQRLAYLEFSSAIGVTWDIPKRYDIRPQKAFTS